MGAVAHRTDILTSPKAAFRASPSRLKLDVTPFVLMATPGKRAEIDSASHTVEPGTKRARGRWLRHQYEGSVSDGTSTR